MIVALPADSIIAIPRSATPLNCGLPAVVNSCLIPRSRPKSANVPPLNSAASLVRTVFTGHGTIVYEVLSEVSGKLVFAAHEINSIEPSEVISNHKHVLLLLDRLHTLFPTNIKKNSATGLNCSCSRCLGDGLRASLGYGAPLALPQRASEIDTLLLCRLAQKSLMNMTTPGRLLWLEKLCHYFGSYGTYAAHLSGRTF